jgi:hypothetical protein
VHENVGWFRQNVSCEVDVRTRNRVAFLGATDHAVTAAVASAPDVEPVVLRRTPRRGQGYEEAPGLWPALLEDAPRHRIALGAVLAWRTARAIVRPERDLLGRADVLRVVGPPPRQRRERWVERTTVLVARRLGVRVEDRRG